MTSINLTFGGTVYDHTRPLFEAAVKIEGVTARFETASNIAEIFGRMMKHQAFDVSELGLAYYLRTLELVHPPFIALPVFPARLFRHSAIFINTSSGIKNPQDLAGKTIGEIATYGHDAGVWPKGILSDEYGLTPNQCRWVIGGADKPMLPVDFVPLLHPADVDVKLAPKDKALGPMLERGEIDAMISAMVPQCVLNDSPRVTRLFPDFESVERDYYRRTGIFPIMHTVVIRRELLAAHPGLAEAVYKGYCDAKSVAMDYYRKDRVEQHASTMIPWFNALFNENRRLFPDDWWPYGVQANRKTLDAYLRYYFEQGLSNRQFTCEDLFVPELLGT